MVKKISTKALGGFFWVLLAGSGIFGITAYQSSKQFKKCNPDQIEYEISSNYDYHTQNIDQIFRDRDGIRLYSHDENGKVIEERYYGWGGYKDGYKIVLSDEVCKQFKCLTKEVKETVQIYRDLNIGEQAYANILKYNFPECDRELFINSYIEVHLPNNQGLSAGIDTWREGKSAVERFQPMKEIK